MLFTSSISIDVLIAFVSLLIATIAYIKYKYSYWTRRGVPQLTPTFPLGNHGPGLPRGFSVGAYTKRFYEAFKSQGVKYGGVYMGLDPYLVIVDPEYAKNILTRDFQYFVDRGIYLSKKNPITVNLLSQKGEEWKNSRTKLTGIFTSAKLKFFFNTIKKCRDELRTVLEILVKDDKEFDVYEILGCYFTDISGSVIYGVEAKSFQHPDAIFRKLGKTLFETFPRYFQLKMLLTICYPKLATFIGITNFQSEIEEFFFKFLPDALEHRKKNNIYRADFLQLLIEMKESGVHMSVEEMVAQSFIIFSGGYETSTTTAMCCLYELALQKDIQEKVRKEINATSKQHNGDFTYESIKEMTYLHQIFKETLRKYPGLSTLNRVAVKDYEFPDGFVIKKGTPVLMPILGYQRDPDNFPDPMKFDADRFEDKSVKHKGYLPFGDGPRNCIGARLGELQIKLALAEIIGNYEIFLSQKTEEPLEIDEFTFVLRLKGNIYLKLKKIDK